MQGLNILLNNKWIKEGIKKEIKKYLETNENENTMTKINGMLQTAVLKGKFTVINVYVYKKERCQMNNLTLHLTELGTGEQLSSK